MFFRAFLTRLFATVIVAALALAPVTAPAAMHASDMHAGMSDMSAMADTSMAADMPCCPDAQHNMPCADCPLVAMCVLTMVQAAPPEMSALPVRHAVRTSHALRDDVFADGLTRPPPDQPPRNLA